jgi:prepilin-type N-terminal cleavage/methylation domain-containing protein
MKTSTRSAFTLVEIMIVVAILLDLALIALPAFLRSRNMAQNTKFVSDLRTCAGAFEMYAAENNKYPATSQPGVIPSGMNVYLRGFPWSSRNSIGGQWEWNPTSYQMSSGGNFSAAAFLGIPFQSAVDDLRMLDIDTRFDNGILATGAFRQVDSSHYVYIIEP